MPFSYTVSLSRKMRTLYLFNNQFNDSILSCLTELSSIGIYIYMRSCIIFLCISRKISSPTDFIASHQFLFLVSIMHIVSSLWLTYSNNSPAGFEIKSSHMRKLENLDLSYNMFNDNILSYLGGFSLLPHFNADTGRRNL